MHDGPIIVGNASIINAIFYAELALEPFDNIVGGYGDVVISVRPVLLVMNTDSMAQLVNDAKRAARAFKEADSLILGKIPGKMTIHFRINL